MDDRAVFTAIVFVVTSGCAWRYLPPSFGITVPTAHRRFTEWTNAGLCAAGCIVRCSTSWVVKA